MPKIETQGSFHIVNLTPSRLLGPLRPLGYFFLTALVALSLVRLGLIAWQWQRIAAVDGFWTVVGLGIRMDTVLLSQITIVPALFILALPNGVTNSRIFQFILLLWLILWTVLLTILESVTPAYISYFDSRPARIFFEYLVYPNEVAPLLIKGFTVTLLVSSVLLVLVVAVLTKMVRTWIVSTDQWSLRGKWLALPVVLVLLLLGGRSSLGHRAANVSTVAFSNDQLVNELALNSTYSLLYAIYRIRNEADAADFYPQMALDEILHRVKVLTGQPLASFSNDAIPTLHPLKVQDSSAQSKNLVIVLAESLGAQFVGRLGGLPITPQLDKLSAEGIWLTRLYATGIRSARGIEAVITGFPPTPARSVLKLGLAQRGFYTIAQTLKKLGYISYFIYGGESDFDNMRGFLMNNGFDVTVDQKDYVNPLFKGSWGVSDEDLFDRADEIFSAAREQPFFGLVFTSSFHSPFEFPDDRIELHEQPKNSKLNAIKYADYALGRFFRKAKKSNYWHNTVFLVVADHDERVRGASLVPIASYHIPGLIMAADLEPRLYDRVASQIDLAPTLLGLLGIEASVPMIGRNLLTLNDDDPGRAVMQFGNNHAFMRGDSVVIHQPDRPAVQFLYRNKVLQPAAIDEELVRDALAVALWPSIAYSEGQYRLP